MKNADQTTSMTNSSLTRIINFIDYNRRDMKVGIVIIAFLFLALGGFLFIRQASSPSSETVQTQSTSQQAGGLSPQIAAVLDKKAELIQTLAGNTELIAAVQASSVKNSSLTPAQIKTLDDQWQATTTTDDFYKSFLTNRVALILTKFQEDHPEFPEIFVTDKVGLNVGQTNKTSDYYQADEDWWNNAFAGGKGLVHHGEIEYDESAKSESISLHVPIYNEQREVVGVIKAVLSLTGIKREL